MAAISGSRLSEAEIERAFARHDADGDGHLDLREMEAMIRASKKEEEQKKKKKKAGKKKKEED